MAVTLILSHVKFYCIMNMFLIVSIFLFQTVNQLLVALAFTGVEVNLVLFAKLVLRQSNAESANTFSRWMGTTYFFSLIGAFISDSYLGRYLTCIIFQVVFNIVSIQMLL